jgi:hypothetical protein
MYILYSSMRPICIRLSGRYDRDVLRSSVATAALEPGQAASGLRTCAQTPLRNVSSPWMAVIGFSDGEGSNGPQSGDHVNRETSNGCNTHQLPGRTQEIRTMRP